MTHENVLERLDDWAGGELPPPERAEVDLHLAGCAECRSEAEALRALLSEVAALPAEITPPRELWSGIAARLEPRGSAEAEASTGIRRLPHWAMQAAAAVALMIGSSLVTYAVVGPKQLQQTVEDIAGSGPSRKPAQSAFVAFQPAEQDYQSAIGDLEMVLRTRRNRLAPETVQTLETNLAIIDEAIRQSREALARDPNSAELARMLGDAYDRKLNVLQQAVQL